MQELPLNGFYSGESRKLSDRRCINWMLTPSDAGSLSTLSLMETVGLDGPVSIGVSGDLAAGPITSQIFTFTTQDGKSAVIVKDDVVFFRGNTGFNSSAQFPNAVGDPLPVETEFARMATNGIECVIICPSSKAGNTIDKLVYFGQDPTFTSGAFSLNTIFGTFIPSLVDVTYVGGRFLYVSNEIFVSGYNRVFYSPIGSIAPVALDFFAPDNLASQLKGIDVINDRIYLFSEDKTFIYSVTASTDIPFRDNGEIEFGLYDANAKCRYKGAIAGLFKGVGGAYGVGMLSGGGIQRIGTPAIDYQIQKALNDSADELEIRMFSFSDKGRDMLCITSSAFTFCYEAATGMWHERRSIGERENWQIIGALDAPDNSIFVGDEAKDGAVGFIDMPFCGTNYSLGTENGELVERVMISAPFNASNQRVMVDELQPQCEVNYDTPVDGWAEPKINLSVSHDFGNTFEQERALNIGRAGNYTQETRFFNVGYYTQAFVIKLRTLNPYPTRIIRLLNRITNGGA